MDEEIRIIVMKAVLEMAKERQKEVSHLDIGNYVTEHYNKIVSAILKSYPKMSIQT